MAQYLGMTGIYRDLFGELRQGYMNKSWRGACRALEERANGSGVAVGFPAAFAVAIIGAIGEGP
jgi:hypothetical protein